MNFLAHLHLADHCQSHLAGNLLADFVRGDPYRDYSSDVAAGIKLHRFVDSYIDSQPEIRAWRRAFPPDIRRVSGIALDMIWDHYLARHWQTFHALPLAAFVEQARKNVEGFEGNEPDHYRQMTQRMWQQEWLIQYQQVASIHQALERMAIRRPKLSSLAECPPFLAGHYQELEQSFFILYPRLMDASQAFWLTHKEVLLRSEK